MPQQSSDISISVLLERSAEFEQAMLLCFPSAGVVLANASTRNQVAECLSELSIEHATTLKAAFTLDAPNSGSALLRLQYEALLRAVWCIYAATPEQVDELASDLTIHSEKAAKSLPSIKALLDAVVLNAPRELSAPLQELDKYSRNPLNSFVHGGIHPLARTRKGYPEELAVSVVQLSNGLVHLSFRLLASLTGSQRRMNRVTATYRDFQGCVLLKDPEGSLAVKGAG